MKAKPLSVNCPGCGSGDVVYSCEPDCCFNHVCGECLTSFQLLTRDLERKSSDKIEVEKRDSCAPTVACARCGSLRVGVIEQTEANNPLLMCVDCSTLLALEFSE